MIIDCHAHIASPRHLPPVFFDGWAETLKAGLPGTLSAEQERRLDELFANLNRDPDCRQLLAEKDEAGIDLTVLLVVDFGIAFPDSAVSLEAIHREVAELCRRTGRFIGFAGVDPRRGQAGLDLFEHALRDLEFRGLKLYPPCGYSPSDPRLFPFYEIAAAYGAPVLTHVGPTSSALPFTHTHPGDVDIAAHAFPKVPFILAHAGVVWHREAAMLAEYRPNVYLDISGFQSELAGGAFAEIMRGHVRRRLARKLLFGTDWPIHRFFGRQKKWVDAVRALETQGYSAADLANLLEGNARRIIPRLEGIAPREQRAGDGVTLRSEGA